MSGILTVQSNEQTRQGFRGAVVVTNFCDKILNNCGHETSFSAAATAATTTVAAAAASKNKADLYVRMRATSSKDSPPLPPLPFPSPMSTESILYSKPTPLLKKRRPSSKRPPLPASSSELLKHKQIMYMWSLHVLQQYI